MKTAGLVATCAILLAAPASAEVVSVASGGFEIRQSVTIDAPLPRAWETLRAPQRWWSKDHTYSDDAANLYLEPQAGGCFCERLPDGGSVEHARIRYIQPPRMIRLSGALGPLQAEAVNGTLTFKLDPDPDKPGMTVVTMSYVVGGYVRGGAEKLAPMVDEVLALQILNFKTAAEMAKPEPAKGGR